MNLNDVVEMEQLEKDRRNLANTQNKQKSIDDIRWEFIADLILKSDDKKISDNDISLIYKYTEKIKKGLGL